MDNVFLSLVVDGGYNYESIEATHSGVQPWVSAYVTSTIS